MPNFAFFFAAMTAAILIGNLLGNEATRPLGLKLLSLVIACAAAWGVFVYLQNKYYGAIAWTGAALTLAILLIGLGVFS